MENYEVLKVVVRKGNADIYYLVENQIHHYHTTLNYIEISDSENTVSIREKHVTPKGQRDFTITIVERICVQLDKVEFK